MHHILFLQDLAVVMTVAALATILFRQFKQPVVLGYILAGMFIGPHTPPFQLVSDPKTIETLAELGVIFLMFSLGLEFSLRKLKKVGGTAFIAASLEIILMVWAGYGLGKLFGWSEMDSIFLGAILSISSTTIIIKALEGLGSAKEKFAQLIFGILIVEDILAILMIALLSGFAVTGQFNAGEIGITVVSLGAFLGVLLVLGLIAVPRLLNYVAKFKSNEMLLVTVIGLCFAVSLITVKLGYSVALGAFLIGAVIAEARQINKIETLMFPVRDLFSAVFFVSIGLLIDPALILKYSLPIIIITVVVVAGKVISNSLGSFLAGNNTRTSLKIGMGLAQIGEFSFIIAALGLSLKVTSDFLYPIAVAVSALTTFLTPYLIKSSDGLAGWLEKIAPSSLRQTTDTYTEWVKGLGKKSSDNPGRKVLRKVILQITINLLLITAVFLAAIFLNQRVSEFLEMFLWGIEVTKAIVWLAAMIVCFPSLFAIWKKMNALGMIVAEMTITPNGDETKIQNKKSIIANTISIIGNAALVTMVILLSSTLLPSVKLLIISFCLISIAAFFLYRSSIKIYAAAQIAIKDTFDQKPDLPELSEKIHPLLEDVKLETVDISKSKVVGKMISELRLRSETGASIIGIERKGNNIVNPEAYEELEPGDKVLLLGYPEQLEEAKKFLNDFSPPRKKSRRES
jgi:CPA2 family monovalent cation:H+ antiporter-2